MQAAVDAYHSKIDDGMAFGEVEVPGDPTTTVNLARVSHLVTKMYFEGDDLFVDIKVLDTPQGLILKQLIEEAPASFRISPCMVGTFEDDNQTLKNVDIVKTHVLATNIKYDGAE